MSRTWRDAQTSCGVVWASPRCRMSSGSSKTPKRIQSCTVSSPSPSTVSAPGAGLMLSRTAPAKFRMATSARKKRPSPHTNSDVLHANHTLENAIPAHSLPTAVCPVSLPCTDRHVTLPSQQHQPWRVPAQQRRHFCCDRHCPRDGSKPTPRRAAAGRRSKVAWSTPPHRGIGHYGRTTPSQSSGPPPCQLNAKCTLNE
jgi:hypothetical protein